MSQNLVYDVLVLNTRNDLDRPAAPTANLDIDVELWIRMVKSLMYYCRESGMALQLNDSSKGYCAVMAANPGR